MTTIQSNNVFLNQVMHLATIDYEIMTLWVIFFLVFMIIPHLGESRTDDDRGKRPLNNRIAALTSVIFISGALFYSFSFFGVSPVRISFSENIEGAMYVIGLSLVVAGMALMLVSRWQLRHMDDEEVIFSLNRSELVTDGIYRYLKHPMYAGLTIIFVGSLLIYRNVPSIVFFFIILYALRRKILIEESSGAARN